LVNGDKNAAAVKAVETRANFMMMKDAESFLNSRVWDERAREGEREDDSRGTTM
jgi:hypothetical protein